MNSGASSNSQMPMTNPMPMAMAPPHGLKPRYELGVDWMQVAIIAGIVILLAGAAWAIWKWWQRRKAMRLAQQAGGNVAAGPGRVAGLVAGLRDLKVAEPFDARAREEFYWRVGIAFRTAVEWRTGIPATALTLRELRDPLRKKLPLPSRETAQALEILDRSEGIKFAEAPATVEEAKLACDLTVKLITKLFPGAWHEATNTPSPGKGAVQ